MNTSSRCLGWVCAGWLVGNGAAFAQAGLPSDVLSRYGGMYAIDCANPQSPRLRVERNTLRVEQGRRGLEAQQLQAAYSYFGQSPPAGFQVALMGQVRGQHSMTFLLYADAQGQYAQIDADRTVMAKLGSALGQARYNSCNASANRQAAVMAQQGQQAAAATMAPVAASSATQPSELVRDHRFKAVWLKLLGPLARESWLARMDGPAPPLKQEPLAGQNWLVAAFCKPRDCSDNNAVVLYDEATGRAYALVHRAGTSSLMGVPPSLLSAELQRIWRREWREGR